MKHGNDVTRKDFPYVDTKRSRTLWRKIILAINRVSFGSNNAIVCCTTQHILSSRGGFSCVFKYIEESD